MFKIDKGVNIERVWGKFAIANFPFEGMEVGDSFFVPHSYGSEQSVRTTITRHAQMAKRKYTTHTVTEEHGGELVSGVRCWRTA